MSYRTFVTEVVATSMIRPDLRSITFAGDELDGFVPVGPDSFLYVLLPPAGQADLTVGRDFTWSAYETMPEAERPRGAYYTLRRWDPDRREIEMWFVLHDDHGSGSSSASAWASGAQVGDAAALWGPRTTYEPPADARWHLLVADDTGLPAVLGVIESLPPASPVVAVIEVDSPTDQVDLPPCHDGKVVWVHRHGEPAGADPARVLSAVQGLARPDGPGYVFGGGESRMMTAVRSHVRSAWDLRRDQVSLVAYWRHA